MTRRTKPLWLAIWLFAMTLAAGPASAQTAAATMPVGDIPERFEPVLASFDYTLREVMIPMRDGVKLSTLIVLPRGAAHLPMLLTRTPYGAASAISTTKSPHLAVALLNGNDVASGGGYIRVIQDVRGKFGSEGVFVMTRPARGPLNATATDETTDAYDTIDWLVKNVPESNGRVGMIGTSYDGFLVLMALLEPHPALKVAVPIAPMVDTWTGDDWFHHGAFRQVYAFDYIYPLTATKGELDIWRGRYDDYGLFLSAGSADGLARLVGADRLPFWKRLEAHPAYDAYWRDQAVDRLLAAKPLAVPTMFVADLWDQEDIYGAVASYAAVEPKDARNDLNFLVLGPWNHGGSEGDGSALGPLKFDGDTAAYFRRSTLKPFLDQYLREGAPAAGTPPVLAYETGTNAWRRYDAWPPAAGGDRFYLQAGFGLSRDTPAKTAGGYDEYVSDPAKPVPYRLRPMRPVYASDSSWRRWLVDDQRQFETRPDVLTYASEALSAPVSVRGQPQAHIALTTTASDLDLVVKLIDVYPDEVAGQPELGGYELMISADILRGRYRKDAAHPEPLRPGRPETFAFPLPSVNHVFLPGHRIMVQVQSSWFPLYDRNPQTYVGNIFLAKPTDYRKASVKVFHDGAAASFVDLPVTGSP